MLLGSHVLELATALAVIFLTLSTFVSALNEFLAAMLHFRAHDLEDAVKHLLADDSVTDGAIKFGQALLMHPRVTNLSSAPPSYLEARTFSSTLLDLILPSDKNGSFFQLRAAVNQLKNPVLREALLPSINDAAGSVDKVRADIEQWFDHAMDRVSGIYKRRAQAIMFLLGLLMAIGLNVDTIRASRQLWADPVSRQQFINQASEIVKTPVQTSPTSSGETDQQLTAKYDALKKSINQTSFTYGQSSLPIGWTDGNSVEGWGWGFRVIGWLITALALSLGAPFWFDFLNSTLKLNARMAGPKPEKKTNA